MSVVEGVGWLSVDFILQWTFIYMVLVQCLPLIWLLELFQSSFSSLFYQLHTVRKWHATVIHPGITFKEDYTLDVNFFFQLNILNGLWSIPLQTLQKAQNRSYKAETP